MLVIVACVFGLAAAVWYESPAPVALAARADRQARLDGGSAIAVDEVAPSLRDAVIVTEDERFYRHDGVDLIGVLRALPYDVVHLSFAQGASTITEQVAKLLYLKGDDHNPWRKLIDAAVALKLESRYSKPEILAAYLNSVYFGEGAYGIAAASERYFGVEPRRLDRSQASLLAGLIQAPSLYDPRTDPRLARERQADVLRALVRTGHLSEAEAAGILSRPLRLRAGPTLQPLTGVDLAPGPAFAWSELGLGALISLAGVGALLATRRAPARIALVAVVLVGAGVIVRSFRSA